MSKSDSLKPRLAWLLIGIMALFVIVGCDLFNSVPDYVGTWILEDEYTGEYAGYSFTVGYRCTLELNEDGTYAMYYEMLNTETNEYQFLEDNESSAGTYSIEGSTVTITTTKKNYYDGAWQETLTTPEEATAVYELSGDTLTLKIDSNEDGDTDDDMETLSLSRVTE